MQERGYYFLYGGAIYRITDLHIDRFCSISNSVNQICKSEKFSLLPSLP